jgi:hypothetical protein
MHLAPATLYLFAAGLLLLGVVWAQVFGGSDVAAVRGKAGTKRNGAPLRCHD